MAYRCSIQATWIRSATLNAMRHYSKASTRNMPNNFVYRNPTILRLALYVRQVIQHGHSHVALAMLSGKSAEMEAFVDKYGSDFPCHGSSVANSSVATPSGGDVVLLTGTTGALGSYLLESLVNDSNVSRVYALNRPDARGARSVYIRQAASFRDRQLDYTVLNSEKLLLLEGNLALDKLGLYDDDLYKEIVDSVTCIIHCGMHTFFMFIIPGAQMLTGEPGYSLEH